MGERTSDRSWVVVNTHPHKERFVLENLARQSFPAYCPMLRARIRHARTTRQSLRPMFPGYVFAAVDTDVQRWKPLLSTFGVRSVMRSGDRLSYLPAGFVEALRAREVDGAIIRPSAPFHVGQLVRLTREPFDGLVATIVEMDERQRLVVLLDLLNRPVRVSVDGSAVSDVLA
jgi:transcriptional antiterminator RfaH